jgi:hypothetical protein
MSNWNRSTRTIEARMYEIKIAIALLVGFAGGRLAQQYPREDVGEFTNCDRKTLTEKIRPRWPLRQEIIQQ